jgi:Resolvase, N terminal domain
VDLAASRVLPDESVSIVGRNINYCNKNGLFTRHNRRPALDQLLTDARRRQFDVLICWRLDRLGRNLKHLVTLLEELAALGIAFVSLNEGIDATTPAGKLQMHILAAIAEFERSRIAERVKAIEFFADGGREHSLWRLAVSYGLSRTKHIGRKGTGEFNGPERRARARSRDRYRSCRTACR